MYYLRVIAGVFTLYTAEVEILVETPPKRATSPTWGPPPPRKQALNLVKTPQ